MPSHKKLERPGPGRRRKHGLISPVTTDTGVHFVLTSHPDVIFNLGSIAFPIGPYPPPSSNNSMLTPRVVGFYAKIWWLDALGGLLLSLVVIFNWAQTSYEHIQHLSGFSATADQRNIRTSRRDPDSKQQCADLQKVLYLTMRFAKTIKQIQGLQAYHAGDKLNVEVRLIS